MDEKRLISYISVIRYEMSEKGNFSLLANRKLSYSWDWSLLQIQFKQTVQFYQRGKLFAGKARYPCLLESAPYYSIQ